MSKIFFTADIHAGADKFGLNTKQWLEPFREVIDEAEDGDTVIMAGDGTHSRNPTVQTVEELKYILQTTNEVNHRINVRFLVGNHDMVRPDLPNSTTLLDGWLAPMYRNIDERNLFTIETIAGIKIGMLNWPMLDMFDIDPSESMDRQLELARDRVTEIIKRVMIDARVERLDVLTGHAHIVDGNGETLGDAPNLLAGRDILLPSDFIDSIANVVLLGHIHTPTDYYVGSTQPTDIRDTIAKRYVVYDSETKAYRSRLYQTSLKLIEVSMKSDDDLEAAIGEVLAEREDLEGVFIGDEPRHKIAIHLIVEETETSLARFDVNAARMKLAEMKYFYIRIKVIPFGKSRRMTEEDAQHIEEGTDGDEIIGGSQAFLNTLTEASPDDKEGAMGAITEKVAAVE